MIEQQDLESYIFRMFKGEKKNDGKKREGGLWLNEMWDQPKKWTKKMIINVGGQSLDLRQMWMWYPSGWSNYLSLTQSL